MTDAYGRLSPFSFDNPPDLVSFTATPAIAEMGSTVSSVVLRWAFNRDLDSLLVNDVVTSSNQDVKTLVGPFTTDQTWTIKGGVQGKTVSGRTALSFQNKAYWGTATLAPTTSGGVLALPSSSFVTTRTKLQIGYPCYDGKFPVYSYPTRLGQITQVKVDIPVPYTRGQTALTKFTDLTTTTVSLTNSSGFTESYFVTIFNSLPFQGFFTVHWV